MELTRLGASGLKISRLALGCMSYGDPTTERAHSGRWPTRTPSLLRQAIELGITFWDTANVYQAAPPRRSSAGLSGGTPAARTSCWPPRCTARCTTGPADRAVS